MKTIYLCDDDFASRLKYRELLLNVAHKHQLQVDLTLFSSGEDLIFHLEDDPNLPHIIYMDVLMGEMNGIATANKLRQMGSTSEIVFLTNCESLVFDAFDTGPVHYLLKESTTPQKFEEVFLRAMRYSNLKTVRQFICKAGAEKRIIPLDDISHFEIWRGVITVYYEENHSFKFWMTMEELQEQVRGKEFIRVHRSYIINMNYITKLSRRAFELKSGHTIPVGITFTDRAQEAFAEHLSRK